MVYQDFDVFMVGFDSLFFARIDYQDKAKRKNERSLEVVWRGSKSLGSSAQIFAGAFPQNYEPPNKFNFEVNDDSPDQDNINFFDYNVPQRVNEFVKTAIEQANVTRTNHIMWTMGNFKDQYAHTWFKQMDKFIHYVNQTMELQHWRHWQHPLVFNKDERSGCLCFGCTEPVSGPSYSCKRCRRYVHHKSCAELPLGLHHPSHPNHPLILFDIKTYRDNREEYENFSKCDVCGEMSNEYSYCCYRCNFNIHIRCSSVSLTIETEFHDHQLTRIWYLTKFTCDFCGKEGNLPYFCVQCDFVIHSRCAACPRKLKVYRHNHPLHLTHSLEFHQSNSPICLLCVRKVDTLWLYYCSRCDFAAHLYCVMLPFNWEHINLQELEEEQSIESESEDPKLHQSFDLKICKVIKTTVEEDGTEIATKIKHFSHGHDLKLTDEILNNTNCNGCVRAILSPFYSCAKCSFFLHKSCAELPKTKPHPLHKHPLTLNYQRASFFCGACDQWCNGLNYKCQKCNRNYNAQCILLSDTITLACHEHRLYLSKTNYKQKCSSCNSENYKVFRCSTCEFVLDLKCATLPQTTWYNQHEHPFTLCYTPEDDSGEYYCEICEEERDPNQWFYYCEDCNFPAHRDCILGKKPNVK